MIFRCRDVARNVSTGLKVSTEHEKKGIVGDSAYSCRRGGMVGGAHHSVWPPLYSENTSYFRTPYISETATYYLAKRNLLIARAGNWRHTPPTEDGIPFLPRHRINGGGMEPTAFRSCCRTSVRTRMPTHDRCPCPLFGAVTPVSFFASY